MSQKKPTTSNVIDDTEVQGPDIDSENLIENLNRNSQSLITTESNNLNDIASETTQKDYFQSNNIENEIFDDSNFDEESEMKDSECLRKNKNSLIFGDISGDETEDEMTPADKAAIDDSFKRDDFNYRKLCNRLQLDDDTALLESFQKYLPSLREKSDEPAKKKRKTN